MALGEVLMTSQLPDADFTLQLLHASDGEGIANTVDFAKNFSSVLSALRDQDIDADGETGYEHTLTLNSGDLYLSGLFFSASEEIWGLAGVGDILIHNALGFQASVLGNHEFDVDTGHIAQLFTGDIEFDEDDDPTDFLPFDGIAFPVVTANLDFGETDPLFPLVTENGREADEILADPDFKRIAGSTIVETDGGERVAVIGAVTPTLPSIVSGWDNYDTDLQPVSFDSNPTDAQLQALADIINAETAQVLADNPDINKVILLAHMQVLNIEQRLSAFLEDVDIVVAGGSNTIIADETDELIPGDSSQGDYPGVFTNADGDPILVLNTDRQYKYVGRLVIGFDEDGTILPETYDGDLSGVYSADAAGAERLGGEPIPEVVEVTELIGDVIRPGEANVFAITGNFLNGQKEGAAALTQMDRESDEAFAARVKEELGDEIDGVRSQETDLGNLIADSYVFVGKQEDPSVVVGMTNGGGIRASIGAIEIFGEDAVRVPPAATEGLKPEGGISENDITTTLAFTDNSLVLVSLTTAQLAEVLEHAVSGVDPLGKGLLDQGMAQISGIRMSFDPSKTARTEITDPETGEVIEVIQGERVLNAGIFDEGGNLIAKIIENGELVDNGDQTFRMATIDFLVEGGSGFPFPSFGDIDLVTLADPEQPEEEWSGAATFVNDFSYTDVFAEYLAAEFGTGPGTQKVRTVDTPVSEDERVQNLFFKDEDTVFAEETTRIATFNVSMNRNTEGDLIADLQAQAALAPGEDVPADAGPNDFRKIAEIIQRQNPDILLLNEFDFDGDGEAVDLFRENFLEVGQNGQDGVEYKYAYVAPSNTGVNSGLDLDNSGFASVVNTDPAIGPVGQLYQADEDGNILFFDEDGNVQDTPAEGFAPRSGANDAFGFGEFEGQFAFVVLSKYEIVEEEIRTFQNFLWKDLPGNLLASTDNDVSRPLFDPSNPFDPADDSTSYFTQEEIDAVRLSSKNHVDVPIIVDGETVHILASHPTPPAFDGPEKRNQKRNHDEIAFWDQYINGARFTDDAGVTKTLEDNARFVIMGDQNADPFDGSSWPGAALQIIEDDKTIGSATDPAITPQGEGSLDQPGGANEGHVGDPTFDTADFGFNSANPAEDNEPGNLRVDYVLGSESGLAYQDGEVVWPADDDPLSELTSFPTSDHRMVSVDFAITERDRNAEINGIEFLGEIALEAEDEPVLGGLSAIEYDPKTGAYYVLSDAQPGSGQGPYRFYELSIDVSDFSLDDGDVAVIAETNLNDADGIPLEADSIDPESLALIEPGKIVVGSEGFARAESTDDEGNVTPTLFVDPQQIIFDLETGDQEDELPVDDKFDVDPDQQTGIRNNTAFEAGTVTPDGQTYVAGMEDSLIQDGPDAGQESGGRSRVVLYDIESGTATNEYVYITNKNPVEPIPADQFSTTGLVELEALDNDGTFLALDRYFAVGQELTGTGHGANLYVTSTAGATDVIDVDSLDGLGFVPMEKQFLLNFDQLGVEIDNVEGIALGPDLPDGRTLMIIVADDNFSDSQNNRVMAFAVDTEEVKSALSNKEEADFRFAAYNSMLSSPADIEEGGAGDLRPSGDTGDTLISRLETGDYEQAQNLAEVVQRERPDVMLLNEIDFDPDLLEGEANAAELLNELYFGVGQNGNAPIFHLNEEGTQEFGYKYVYIFPANTGVPSGFDINNDGIIGEIATDPVHEGLIGGFPEGDADPAALRAGIEPRDLSPAELQDEEDSFVEQPNDAYGFGRYPGQYSMALFSNYEVAEDEIRTFQEFLWKDMPNSGLTRIIEGERPLYDPTRPFDETDPENEGTSFFTEEEFNGLRLSSKNHVDVPVIVDGQTIHILGSHPTPATYSLSDNQNEFRNEDEIRLWKDYVKGADYIYDDNGVFGGLQEGARFIIAGDLNADPFDGAAEANAANQLLDDPLINGSATDPSNTPSSLGGIQDDDSGGTHNGNPAFDTVDYSQSEPGRGNVRVDYALPSTSGLTYEGGTVVWPLDDDPYSAAVDYPTSDHKMVRIDLTVDQKVVAGTEGGDTLFGTDEAELFEPNGGTDIITTGGGADEIIFTDTDLTDVLTITDFEAGVDMLDLGEAQVAREVSRADLTILLLDTGDRIVFEGLSENPLNQDLG